MTTIAYKDGIIAYDGRCTGGSTILEDDHDKKIVRDGYIYFLSGEIGYADDFIEMYRSEIYDHEKLTKIDLYAMVVTPEKICNIGIEDGKIYENPMRPEKYYALGSGYTYALAAMDFGKTAKEAIKYASTRDLYTGGKIRTHKVNWL